jgi:RNA polymerase sigma-70 factor (ECF subfamily)
VTPASSLEAVARRSYGKLIAVLAARTQDVAGAEDALSEAFAAALVDWPRNGIPANPEGWLLTVARRKSIDAHRKHRHEETSPWPILLPGAAALQPAAGAAEELLQIDPRLALMFVCAHPAIEVGIRAPLMLQVVLGLDAKRIASAFLVAPAAMGKRLVRAKDKIRQAGIPFVVPERAELAGRLEAVLDAVYAAFGAGWNHAGETDAARRELTGEALYLARLLVELMPNEAGALGLLSLLLHAEARRAARRDERDEYLPFDQQDPARWNGTMIAEAESLLLRASAHGVLGRYQLEAALQSAHVERRRSGQANWKAMLQIYDALVALTGSPVVALNRALALAELQGAEAALEALPELPDYQPYWAVSAELLARAGRSDEARRAYETAIELERDLAVRRFLERRLARLSSPAGPPRWATSLPGSRETSPRRRRSARPRVAHR